MADDIKTIPNYDALKEEEKRPNKLPVLTIDRGDTIETEQDKREVAWHNLKNSFITHKNLNGVLIGMETTANDGKVIGVTDYNGIRVIIPAQELIEVQSNNKMDNEAYSRAISSMIGAEISYTIIALDDNTQTVIGSRVKANERNRKTFFFDKDSRGYYKIYEGSIVEARVTAIKRNYISVEIFGALTQIKSNELSWKWMSDIESEFSVGDRVMVKITKITGRNNENEPFSVSASVRQATNNKLPEIIKGMRKNNLYTGKIVDIIKGTYIIELTNGVTAAAHTNLSRRDVMKGDTVAFTVRFVDTKTSKVSGNITRLIQKG